MDGHVKGAFFTAALLTIFMAILPPALVGGADGAAWDFIERFQGLITGLLAVGAAFWTIVEMRASQVKQEQQHRAQLFVATLNQRLAIFRLMRMVTPFLEGYPETCKRYFQLERTAQPWSEKTSSAFAIWLLATDNLKQIVEGDYITACAPLFTPPVVLCLKEVEGSLNIVATFAPQNVDQVVSAWSSHERPVWYSEASPYVAEDLSNQVAELRRQLDVWYELMIGESFATGT